MAARGVSTDYSSRLVQKEVHGVKLKGYVAHSRVLADVAVGGGGEGAASGQLWCVRWYDTTEEEELLEADLLPLLVPGPRGGGKGSGGKAAQPAAPARLVARKVAERPPPFEEGANAGAWQHNVPSRCAAARRCNPTCAASEHDAAQGLSLPCLQRRHRSALPALPRGARSPSNASVACRRRCVAASRGAANAEHGADVASLARSSLPRRRTLMRPTRCRRSNWK